MIITKILEDGSTEWYLNGVLHREDGPAVEYSDGTCQWWVNGNLHREDGPAIEYADGGKEWYINHEFQREEEGITENNCGVST